MVGMIEGLQRRCGGRGRGDILQVAAVEDEGAKGQHGGQGVPELDGKAEAVVLAGVVCHAKHMKSGETWERGQDRKGEVEASGSRDLRHVIPDRLDALGKTISLLDEA